MSDGVGQVVSDIALSEVLEGLGRSQKVVSSKYHYDARGSELFEEITRLDEYYLTRTERALLERWMPVWIEDLRPTTLIELGAGSAEKSRIVLDAMKASGSATAYVPVDVSAEFLAETARALEVEYPKLAIIPEVADITAPIRLPEGLPAPRWIAFLGSTLGNFSDDQAVTLLGQVADALTTEDRFLLGVDLRPGDRKTVETVEAAYNDARGITALFSLNILSVLNAEFGSDFDMAGFRHRSIYNTEAGRIETFLVSLRDQDVSFPSGEVFQLAEGETIRSEISCKYDRPTVDMLFDRAGLTVDRWIEDDEGLYAVVLGRTA